MNRLLAAAPMLRAIAILIAIAGMIDPAIPVHRATKPNVAVLAADPARDSALVDRVARSLAERFAVYRTPFPAADATVIVGNDVPAGAIGFDATTFAVADDRASSAVSIDALRAPAAAPMASRIPIDVTVRARKARGRSVDVALRARGLVVDRVTKTVASDDERVPVALAFVPSSIGAAPLRVTASIAGVSDSAAADLLADVRDARWSVLFYDARPSWMSTFVRRAAERDPRLVVTSRVVTSRQVTTDAGQPPSRLDDLVALGAFDAVVVGAPEALSDRDVAGLEAFLRRRGGSVVLLLDRLDRRAPAPFERLTGVTAWTVDSATRALSISRMGDSAGLRASELALPTRLSETASALAVTRDARADSLNGRAAVWRTAIGAGRVIVSGALDAWRYRDRAISAFDTFWQTLIADAASAAPPPVDVTVANRVLRPGERTDVEVTVRDAAIRTDGPTRATATAVLESDSLSPMSILLSATPTPGRFRGTLRAPSTPGLYRVTATSNGNRAQMSIAVAPTPSHASSDNSDLVATWVRARSGRVVSASRVAELPAAIREALKPRERVEMWNPMRSAWWIGPFAIALGIEWLSRRRKGRK